MAYEPTTEAGKKALADGADPVVVEEMEKSGELYEGDSETKTPDEHVDNPQDQNGDDKGHQEDQGGEGDHGAEDHGKESDDEDGQPNRTAQSMPMWKHKEELKKAREAMEAEFSTKLEKSLADAAAKAGNGSASNEDVKKIAEEFNLDSDVASAMIERMAAALEQRLNLGDIRKNEAARAERDRELAEQQGFENEFADKATQDAITAAGGQISPEVKAKVKELAYRSDYARYRLSDIIRLEAGSLFTKPAGESRSAESGRGGASRGVATPKNLEEMTSDDINAMSDEDFLKFSNELGGKGSRFGKITNPKR